MLIYLTPEWSEYCSTVFCNLFGWLGDVVASVLDSWSGGHGFNYQPLHCRAMTLGKLFTPMCLCSPSSILWYLARAFMSTRLYVAANSMGPMNRGYFSSGSAAIGSFIEPRYKLSTFPFTLPFFDSGTFCKKFWLLAEPTALIHVSVLLHKATKLARSWLLMHLLMNITATMITRYILVNPGDFEYSLNFLLASASWRNP